MQLLHCIFENENHLVQILEKFQRCRQKASFEIAFFENK